MYPQLKVFSTSSVIRTLITSVHASNVGAYEYQLAEASSINFDRVVFNSPLYCKHPILELKLDIPIKSNGAYSDSNYSYNTWDTYFEFVKKDGGYQIYELTTGATGYPADTRYVLFNVRNIKINYRFELEDAPAYNVDMSKRGLTDITTELGLNYGAILDSTVVKYTDAGYVNVTPSGDTLSFAMTQPFKYNYSVDAFTAINEEGIEIEDSALTRLDSEKFTYSIADLDEVYIRITIGTEELPWGLYRIDCGNA